MKNIINEQANAQNIQPAEAEQVISEQEGTASFGKFKSAEALLNAYNSLQAEFTKRCQRIKELEDATNKEQSLVEEKPHSSAQGTTLLEKQQILKDYLIQLESGKSDAIVMEAEGISVKVPYQKPKTIAEAGKLANELLKK